MNRSLQTLASLLTLLCCVAITPRALADDDSPSRLFTRVAPLSGGGDDLCRVGLSEDILSATRPSLSDVRILDDDGAEVPFLIDTAVPWPTGAPPRRVPLVPDELARVRRFARSIEEVEFHLPAEPLPEGSTWTLEVRSNHAGGLSGGSFVRNFVLSEVDGANGGAPASLAQGTIFQLDNPLRARLRIALPNALPNAEYRLVLEGDGGFIEPIFSLVATPMSERGATLTASLQPELIPPTPGNPATVYRVPRPSGIRPTHLVFETRSAFFAREVRVYDVREGREPVLIASSTIFRAPEVDAEVLEIPLGRSEGFEWRVEVDGGGSAPLLGLTMRARTEQPSLFFECTPGASLYFGGGRARLPEYDVQRFAGTTLGEAIARGEVTRVFVGESEDNPDFDDAPALAFLLRPGAAVARDDFRMQASLTVSGAREGVSRLTPTPSLLASADPELRTIRVVDGDGRQWPLVVAPRHLEVVVGMATEVIADGEPTTYRLTSVPGPVALDELHVRTTAEFVRRAYSAQVVDADGAPVGAPVTGELVLDPGADHEVITLRGVRGDIELTIDDGDDAPLTLEVSGVAHAPSVYLLAPDGAYGLLSDGDAAPFEYEVQRALPLVLATEVVDARLGPSLENPTFAPPPIPPRFTAEQIAVWVGLGVAVLVLGFLTLRVSRQPMAATQASTVTAPAADAGANAAGPDDPGAQTPAGQEKPESPDG